MTEKDKKILFQFIRKQITEKTFLKKFSLNPHDDPKCIFEILDDSYIKRDSDGVYMALRLAVRYEAFDESYVELLCKLIESDFHFSHEDIARYLQLLASPLSIESLYNTAKRKLDYLSHDNSYALARKCIWALGEINTNESINKLHLLYDSEDDEIQNYVNEQWNRLESK